MKRFGLTPLSLAATLFLAAAPALHPQDEPRRNPKSEGAPPPLRIGRPEEILQRFDKNGDGKLDEDEQAEAHEVMLKEQMGRQAAKAAATPDGGLQFRRKMLELFDKNKDGRLDDDERAEARKYAEAHGLGEGGAVREELLKRFDKNADGKLDAEETAALRKFLRERREPDLAPSAASEKERLQRVAAEVARRRAEREKAQQAPAAK